MNDLMLLQEDKVFTSRDIAEWTGKEHYNVLKDIEDEITKLGEIGFNIFKKSSYNISTNIKPYKMYEMNKIGLLQIAARYDAKVRFNIICKALHIEEFKTKEILKKESIEIKEKRPKCFGKYVI